jgi:glutathione S-transferase
MIELFQFAWSPYCIVQSRILEFARVRFRSVAVPVNDRSRIWRLTRQRYYQVPVLRDGRNVVFETAEESQVVAKYLDDKLQLGLFPRRFEGVQSLIWRHVEAEVEDLTFRLNDSVYRKFVPRTDWLGYVRHKERKFGRGCLEQWAQQQPELHRHLAQRLQPYEDMLLAHPFLLDERPRFVDFDLYGMLANLRFSGLFDVPEVHVRLRDWFTRMSHV